METIEGTKLVGSLALVLIGSLLDVWLACCVWMSFAIGLLDTLTTDLLRLQLRRDGSGFLVRLSRAYAFASECAFAPSALRVGA